MKDLADLISGIWRSGNIRPTKGAAMTTEAKATTKHSPGPWSVARDGLFTDEVQGIRIRAADGSVVGAAVRGPVKQGRTTEEWEANANLFAAAPALLAAAKELLALHEPRADPGAGCPARPVVLPGESRPMVMLGEPQLARLRDAVEQAES